MLHKGDAPEAFRWGEKKLSGARVATNCDLCESLEGGPRCVKHCPHEAALRADGVDVARSVGLDPIAATKPE